MCSRAAAWTEGKWETPECDQGRCFMVQAFEECKGKDDYYDLKDGTFCHDEKRNSRCPTSGSKYSKS